jgi:hypothetical protein
VSRALAILVAACSAPSDSAPAPPPPPAPADAATPDAPAAPEVWLKGSTHVHTAPSFDSTTPTVDAIEWYTAHHYDFIVLTNHDYVSELAADRGTTGQVIVGDPKAPLIVFAGIELTEFAHDCVPRGDPSGSCAVHVNLLGVPTRPAGPIEWADRSTHERLPKYLAALQAADVLGGIPQLNHPQWFWGMTADLLAELAHAGFHLVEIANSQMAKWNAGDATHPSMEALWDAVLARGETLYGVASDDAHSYGAVGKHFPGGGWIMVRARREPQAILAAIIAGRFYASTGVVLERAEVVGNELVIEAASAATIDFVENGVLVETVHGTRARRTLPASGYVRAVVTQDGTKAWVQPARRR